MARGWCASHYNRWRHYGTPTAVEVPSDFTAAEWFWRSVDKSAGPDACWPWTRYRAANGYGRCRHGWTHRYALELTLGRKIRRGMEAAHRCDNPPCCNPAHLYEADRSDNMRDAADRSRMPAGERNVHAKLTEDDVRIIRSAPLGPAALADRFGVSRRHIIRIRNGERWRCAA